MYSNGRNCNPKPPCPTPLQPVAQQVTNIVQHTTVINQGDQEYNFLVDADGWQQAIITELIGKNVTEIFLDGVKRIISTIAESNPNPPADGQFAWKRDSGTLIYRESLNQNQWVSIKYKN